jgi:ATP-dependent Clp protease protease subunit
MFARLSALALVVFMAFATMPSTAKTDTTRLVFDDKTLVLRGEVNEASVAKLQEQIFASKDQEIVLYLDTPGGNVEEGMALVSAMEASGKNFKCVANYAASMGFYIFENCSQRYILPHGLIMQHVTSYSLKSGREPNNYAIALLFHEQQQRMDKMQADRLGMTLAEFQAKIIGDWWMSGDMAVEQNAADETVNATCSPELTKQRYTTEETSLFGTSTLTWSGCPLINAPLKVESAPKEDAGGGLPLLIPD